MTTTKHLRKSLTTFGKTLIKIYYWFENLIVTSCNMINGQDLNSMA